MPFQIYDERIAFNLISSIPAATGTAAVTTWTADTSTRRVDAISVSSDDTADKILVVNINISAADQALCEITIPAGAGHGAVPPVEVLEALGKTNLAGLVIGPGNTIRYNLVAAASTGKTIKVITWGGVM